MLFCAALCVGASRVRVACCKKSQLEGTSETPFPAALSVPLALPTKKGIDLSVEEWQALKAAVADIDVAVAAAQASVGPPASAAPFTAYPARQDASS